MKMRSYFGISPWSELNRMWDLMDRVSPLQKELDTGSSTFPLDIFEQENRLFVRASLPGVKPENLNVNLEEGVLTISGETKDEFSNPTGRVYHREHTYGKFVRSVRVPDEVDESAIDAQFDNGVLTVSMPVNKPQPPQPRQIPIRSTSFSSKPIEAGKGADFAYADKPQGENQKGQTNSSDRDKARSSRDKQG
jgi:HSP20 family protein